MDEVGREVAQCEGCDGTLWSDLMALYECELDGKRFVAQYCDLCAAGARGELEGAPWCGQPMDSIVKVRS